MIRPGMILLHRRLASWKKGVVGSNAKVLFLSGCTPWPDTVRQATFFVEERYEKGTVLLRSVGVAGFYRVCNTRRPSWWRI